MKALLSDPISVFLGVSIALFALYFGVQSNRKDVVVVTEETRTALVENFELMTGGVSTPEYEQRLISDYVSDELLFREAVSKGMHLGDARVRSILLTRMKSDIVGFPDDPGDEEIANYYAQNLSNYQSERAFSFQILYFEDQPPADALSVLNAGGDVRGDTFWRGDTFENYGASIVRGLFDQSFVDALDDAELNIWTGPLQTSRGWNFVRLEARTPSAILPFANVQDQVRMDLMAAENRDLIGAYADRLKRDYDVLIEP